MSELNVDSQKALNLWTAYARKLPPVETACRLVPQPALQLDQIGGLEAAKGEILTYACAATHPKVYERWGTVPPTGLMLIGPPGAGKTLLAEALASRAGTAFLAVDFSRLVFQLLRAMPALGEILSGWNQTLKEMPATTVFFSGFDANLSRALQRPDVPAGPVLDLMFELVDRTVDLEGKLLVGSTSSPESLPNIFLEPGRFERVVEVVPIVPDDVIAALEIHAAQAEKRAGRPLFLDVEWKELIGAESDISIGDWIRSLHAALRKKARYDAAGETCGPVTTAELRSELERFRKARTKLPSLPGSYL